MSAIFEPDVTVLPNEWPGTDREAPKPGDLSIFVPQGLAMAAPAIIRPFGGMADPSFYGAQGTIQHPIRSAPINDDTGGVVYFNDYVSDEQIGTLLNVLGVRDLAKDYAVFKTLAKAPSEDIYLEQIRLISFGAVQHFFGISTDGLTEQPLICRDAILRFYHWQKAKWNGGSGEFSLAGCLGGDGDWAKERVAFGFMVENAYWGVYRAWSRPWLITK